METSKTNQIKKERMQHMLSIFRTLEIVSQYDQNFNPTEHYNRHDPEYSILMKYYDEFTSVFRYKEFIKNSIAEIGPGFQNVLIGYESLVEQYCDPISDFLQPQKKQIIISGDILEHFDNFDEFRSGIYGIISVQRNRSIYCIDKNKCLITPENLLLNKGFDLFPVTLVKVDFTLDYILSHKSEKNN